MNEEGRCNVVGRLYTGLDNIILIRKWESYRLVGSLSIYHCVTLSEATGGE